MTQRRKLFATWCVVGFLAAALPAWSATEVATVAAVVGGAELQRGGQGAWQLATVGSALFEGDRVRTRQSSRAKLIFQDDSVVDVGPGSELQVGTQVFDDSARRYKGVLSLIGGKIRAVVSDYYKAPGARYEVETPTAVSGVRGTEFIVQYDSTSEYTDIVGIEDEVFVEGTLGVVGGGVKLRPRTATRVQKGRFPSVPRRIDDALLRQYLDGLEIIGTGGRDSLGSSHPAARGALLAKNDAATSLAGGPTSELQTAAAPTARRLVVGVPGETRAAQFFPDSYANSQPIVDYRVTPPNQAPTGTVKVGF
ncbi:MAG TPA: FecR family protein [Candidatus Binatia bacterium]|nr:FecR family protein [Candidatus Binatia bacterium]